MRMQEYLFEHHGCLTNCSSNFYTAIAMRIFFPNATIAYPPTIGGHIHRYQVIRNLVDLGHEVVAMENDENPHTRKTPRHPVAIARALRSCDVLYCRLEQSPNNATRLTEAPWRWFVRPRTRVVWELNISLVQQAGSRPRDEKQAQDELRKLRSQASYVDAAICVTQSIADEARERLGIEHAVVIPNASDPEMFRPDLPPPAAWDEPSDVLHVACIASGLNLHHDIELILEAAKCIERERLPIRVHMLGRAGERLQQQAPPTLRLHGPISYLALPNYLAQMRIGLALYNRRYDHGSPLKLFDYLASGCVVLGSPSQPMEEVLAGSHAGMVQPWNADSLVATLHDLHHHPQKVDEMARAGRRLIENRYNWRCVAEKTAHLLDGSD